MSKSMLGGTKSAARCVVSLYPSQDAEGVKPAICTSKFKTCEMVLKSRRIGIADPFEIAPDLLFAVNSLTAMIDRCRLMSVVCVVCFSQS